MARTLRVRPPLGARSDSPSRAVGFALDADISVGDAARLLVVDAQHDRMVLEAARVRILRAANGPVGQRAARSVWMAVQLLDADDDRPDAFDTPRIVLVGMPGAGKGTQGRRLAGALDVSHVAMGALVREVAHEETPFGFQAQLFMERGDLVPDSLVLEILASRFAADDIRTAASCSTASPARSSRRSRWTRSSGRARSTS